MVGEVHPQTPCSAEKATAMLAEVAKLHPRRLTISIRDPFASIQAKEFDQRMQNTPGFDVCSIVPHDSQQKHGNSCGYNAGMQSAWALGGAFCLRCACPPPFHNKFVVNMEHSTALPDPLPPPSILFST